MREMRARNIDKLDLSSHPCPWCNQLGTLQPLDGFSNVLECTNPDCDSNHPDSTSRALAEALAAIARVRALCDDPYFTEVTVEETAETRRTVHTDPTPVLRVSEVLAALAPRPGAVS